MKRIVFGHHPCIDGVGAMWAIKERFDGEDITFRGMDYASAQYNANNIRSIVSNKAGNEPADLYFVDYLPNDTSVIQEMLDAGHRVTVLDHHQSAEANLKEIAARHEDNPNLNVVFDHNNCGSIITWNAMFPGQEPPEILELINRMDLLTLQGEQDEKAAAYIDDYDLHYLAKKNIEQFSKFHEEMEQGGIKTLAAKGQEIWDHEMERVDELMAFKRDLTIGQNTYPSVPMEDIRNIGRVGVKRIADEMTSDEQPVGLLIKETPHIVSISVRVHPDHAQHTHHVVETLKMDAMAVANEREKEQITGGGRGVKGQLGQAALRMPHSVAEKLGIAEPQQGRGQQASRG